MSSLNRVYSHKYPTTVIEPGRTVWFFMDVSSMSVISFSVIARNITTVRTVANDTGVSIANDTLDTVTAHGYFTGMSVQLTSTGTLPTGLALATTYFVYVNSDNIITLFTTLAQALAATEDNSGVSTSPGKVNITALGTAGSTITITPVTVSGATYKLQWSNNFEPVPYFQSGPFLGASGPFITAGNFVDVVAGESASVVTNTINTTSATLVSANNPGYKYCRILFSITTGSVQINVDGQGK